MGTYLMTVCHRTAQAVPSWRFAARTWFSHHIFLGAVTGMIGMGVGLAMAVSLATIMIVLPLSFLLGW